MKFNPKLYFYGGDKMIGILDQTFKVGNDALTLFEVPPKKEKWPKDEDDGKDKDDDKHIDIEDEDDEEHEEFEDESDGVDDAEW